MLGQFARFDLGKSFFQNKDVWQLVKESCRCPSAWAVDLFHQLPGGRAAGRGQGGAGGLAL
jgi:ABC-type microcin C transport system permease subunit YejB